MLLASFITDLDVAALVFIAECVATVVVANVDDSATTNVTHDDTTDDADDIDTVPSVDDAFLTE